MNANDESPNLPVEAEYTTVLNDHMVGSGDTTKFEDNTTSPTEDVESTHVTIGSLYSEHLRRTKEKADKKKAERKKKKKKTEDHLILMGLYEEEEAEEYVLFKHEILSSPETSLVSRNQAVSEQIRCAQGRVVPDHFQLRLDIDSGVFFGLARDGGHYVGKSSTLDGHICVIGESGRGKTESIVKPTMLTFQNGSAIVFDLKDNLYGHWLSTARSLGKRSVVFWLDGPEGCSCYYDPLEPMRRNNSTNIVAAATDLAYALIPLPEGTKEPFWAC